ncbi:hypothetical protein EG832_01520 [bacterium]|nr:hypothetical protein [bacterium]
MPIKKRGVPEEGIVSCEKLSRTIFFFTYSLHLLEQVRLNTQPFRLHGRVCAGGESSLYSDPIETSRGARGDIFSAGTDHNGVAATNLIVLKGEQAISR